MSVMDSIEEKYQQEIAALKEENIRLKEELECYKLNPDEKTELISKWQKNSFAFEDENYRLRKQITMLTESRDEWKRQWRLMEAAEKKAEEQIAALKTEVEQLKFGRESLPCPRADK